MKYMKQAQEYYRNYRYEAAIKACQKALKYKENEFLALHSLALCYIKLKQYERAVPLLRAAISRSFQGEPVYNLGYCYLMSGNYKKALFYFNTAWSMMPEDESCEKAINRILETYKKKL